MNKRIFLLDRKKHLKRLVTGALVAALSGTMLYVALQSGPISIGYILLLSSLIVVSGSMALAQFFSLINRRQPGLELDDAGLHFKGTALGRTIGKVKWADIDAIQTGTAHGSHQLFVKLTAPKLYATTTASPQLRKIRSAHGFPLNADKLAIDFHEMETYVMQYYHQYHSAPCR